MEFGKVEKSELDTINFALQPDPAGNESVLKAEGATTPEIYIGCAKWGRSEWVGTLYPLKTREKDFLENYVQHYNSIELNATHYKLYDAATIRKWSDKAGSKDFKFCPKMYKEVTHAGSLKDKEFLTGEFLKGVLEFKEHLGPIFIQVSESFSPHRKEELFDYLRSLPQDLQFFVEVRHPDWFASPAISNEYFSFLEKQKLGAVITDAAGRRDCVHMHLTIPKTFIRYVGNSLHQTDYTRIDEWVERIRYWLDNGLQELYFFMHMHNEALSPELTAYLTDKLNATCGLHLQRPTFLPKQKGLFD